MYFKWGKIQIRITFAFAVFVAYMCNTSKGERLAYAFICALAHECVHLVFLLLCGCKGITVTLRAGGAAIRCTGMEFTEVKKQLLILLSAPAFNLISGAVMLWLGKKFSPNTLLLTAYTDLALGAVNLLPLSFLDGGRALKALAEMKHSPNGAKKILFRCEFFVLALLVFTVLVLWGLRINPVALTVFTAYSLVSVFFGGSEVEQKQKKC